MLLKLKNIGIILLSFNLLGSAMAQNKFVTTSFENLEVGTAINKNGPTGSTVFYFPKGAIGAIDKRGGAIATRESSSLEEGNTWGWLDALVFSGGSTFGLEAADGVMREILKIKGGVVKFDTIPAVPAAIVYDFTGRKNSVFPTRELGAKAFLNKAKNKVPYGAVGAGVNVSVGKWFSDLKYEKSGQGAAYFEKDNLKILVVTVLNAVGNVKNKKGEIIKGSLDPKKNERVDISTRVMEDITSEPTSKNTTITAVITNIKLSRLELKRVATMAHTSMAGSIDPFHTPWDGDVLFAISTQEAKKEKTVNAASVGAIASNLLQSAIMRAVGYKE